MPLRRRYLVVYERGKRNFSGFVPDVPGCVSCGTTLKQMREMLTEALEFHLSSFLCDGEPIPDAITTSFDFGEFVGEPGEAEYYVVEWLTVRAVKSIYRNAKKVEPGYSIIEAARASRVAASTAQGFVHADVTLTVDGKKIEGHETGTPIIHIQPIGDTEHAGAY